MKAVVAENKTSSCILGFLRFNFLLNFLITILIATLNDNNNTESKCLCCLNNNHNCINNNGDVNYLSPLGNIKCYFQPKESLDFKCRQVDGRVFCTTNSTQATSAINERRVDRRLGYGKKVHFGRFKNCEHIQLESLEDFTENSSQTIRPCCIRQMRFSKNPSADIVFPFASPDRVSRRGHGRMMDELGAKVTGRPIQNILSSFHSKKQKRSIGRRPKESETESILQDSFPGAEAKMFSKSRPKSRLIHVSDSGATSIGAFKMREHDRWKDWKKEVDSFNHSTADDNANEIIDLNARRRPQHHRHRHHHHQQQQPQQRHNKPSRPKKPKDDSRNTGKGLQLDNRHQYQESIFQKNIFRHKPASENVERIIVAGLFSLSPPPTADEINAESILSSAHLAIKHINANRSILPHHHLELHWNDTKCDMAIATRILFEMMHFKPTKAILFGDSCSRVTVPIAETAVWWNLTQGQECRTGLFTPKSCFCNQ